MSVQSGFKYFILLKRLEIIPKNYTCYVYIETKLMMQIRHWEGQEDDWV